MNEQPLDGDVILHCGHVDRHKSWHWHRVEPPIPFTRPDGSKGAAFWIILCSPCQAFFGTDVTKAPIRGDGIWKGNEPVEFVR